MDLTVACKYSCLSMLRPLAAFGGIFFPVAPSLTFVSPICIPGICYKPTMKGNKMKKVLQ